jgi:flagellar motility protein MotE (MotC chaperone)
MPAREAARVFEHMDDYEVQVILSQLGNREAAAILGNLAPERAAVISRAVIRGGGTRP